VGVRRRETNPQAIRTESEKAARTSRNCQECRAAPALHMGAPISRGVRPARRPRQRMRHSLSLFSLEFQFCELQSCESAFTAAGFLKIFSRFGFIFQIRGALFSSVSKSRQPHLV
jgi:hypothetical protein